MSAATKAILTNKEIIAINQDAIGPAGRARCSRTATQSMWAKPLNANGARAAVLFNEGAAAADMTVSFADIGLAPRQRHGARSAGARGLGSFKDATPSTSPRTAPRR